ncbi:hypothetical protein AB0C10_27565 [Microbispora amethystogenes]|uniref:hypothetical protein n=1 Tax=Microbispora amethystogenes TaxID=1427754 RepID=UPI0033C15D91
MSVRAVRLPDPRAQPETYAEAGDDRAEVQMEGEFGVARVTICKVTAKLREDGHQAEGSPALTSVPPRPQ